MFVPNLTGMLRRKSATRDLFGKESYDAPVPLPCALIRGTSMRQKTSVRADSSASRGAGDQIEVDALILVPASVIVSKDDVIEVAGLRIGVTSFHPRYDVLGNHDHNEVGGMIKKDL